MEQKQDPIHMPPEGLIVTQDFLTEAEEKQLITDLDALEAWQGDGLKHRRVQQYGHVYDFETHGLVAPKDDENKEKDPKSVPKCLANLMDRVMGKKDAAKKPFQIFVNEYKGHHGIGPHIDHPKQFGPEIWSLSLGSTCPMRFTREGQSDYLQMMQPRSLTLMSGPSRYDWQHEIPYSKLVHWMDPQTQTKLTHKREKGFRRISITFREVIMSYNP